MKGQVPAEAGGVIVGAILMWIGYIFLSTPASSALAGSFNLYVGGGFMLAGIVSIVGSVLSLAKR